MVLAAIIGAQPVVARAAGDFGDNTERAEQLKYEGDKAMRDERYTDALNAYNNAFRFTSRGSELWVRLLNNRARALIGLKRYVDALQQLEEFEKLSSDELKALVPELADLLKEVRAHVVTLQVSSNVDGARVSVEGKVVGTTPLQKPVRLNEGTATIEIVADGYVPYRQTFELRGGEVMSIQPWPEQQGPVRPGSPPVGPSTVEGTVQNTKGSRVPGFVVLGVGAVGLTVGAVTGSISMWKTVELKRKCANNLCLVEDSEDGQTAKILGHVSTGSLIVGGIGAVAGVVLIVVRPGSGKTSSAPAKHAGGCGVTWSAGIGLRTVDVRGSFQ